ncbi:MAG: energy transducer TonB [Deltaproteobacteria bacterium]|nr:energy transducer TonB [Deltaproteobacteria bacterium]
MINSDGQRRQGLDLGLALVISAWVHILGFALLQYVPPLPASMSSPPLVMEVEIDVASLKKPVLEELKKTADRVLTDKASKTSVKAVLDADSENEDTISLESKAPEYLSYMHQIKNRIKNHWIYPAGAQKNIAGGRLMAVFTLSSDGRLLRVVLDSSSGHAVLDEAALEALHRAAPYPGFPDHIKLKRLNIRAVFDYRFQYIGVK